MSKDEMVGKLKNLIDEYADIIMGRNPQYTGIVGWHNRYALGLAIKQVLGQFWLNHRGDYGDDPGKVLFAWLAASLFDAALASMDNPDLAGASINTKKAQVVKLIMGTQERVR